MQAMAQTFHTVEQTQPVFTTAKTTLYQLIEAIGEEVQPGEDRLVIETLLDLIHTGQITFPDSMGESVSCLSLN